MKGCNWLFQTSKIITNSSNDAYIKSCLLLQNSLKSLMATGIKYKHLLFPSSTIIHRPSLLPNKLSAGDAYKQSDIIFSWSRVQYGWLATVVQFEKHSLPGTVRDIESVHLNKVKDQRKIFIDFFQHLKNWIVFDFLWDVTGRQ